MSKFLWITERLGPELADMLRFLEGAGREEISAAMGMEVQALIVDHLQQLALTRHDTASRLGASPTGFIAQAADAAADATAVSADEDGVSIRIRHPVVARAFRDIQIRPKTAKALAIPQHAIAYGKRPAELWESHHLFIARGMIWMPQPEGQHPLALYALVASVTQRQDRSLMPSDEAMADAAAGAVRNYIREALT